MGDGAPVNNPPVVAQGRCDDRAYLRDARSDSANYRAAAPGTADSFWVGQNWNPKGRANKA